MSVLVDGMTWILNWFFNLTGSYGVAIILLTIAVKMALYPLSVKQMRSMKMTQVLQPKIKEVQEKFKNDPQKAQAAVMEIYKEYGANPLAGCLPLLIQMPIFFALFSTLRELVIPKGVSPSFLYNPDWNFWIHSLKEPDKFYLLPALAVLTTFLLQRMTTNMQDQTQRTMLYTMPLVIGFFTFNLPSGLGLYWVVTNVVGAIQQYFINKQPVPIVIKEETTVEEGSNKKRKNNRGGH